jgi:hypothetical protein
MSNLNREEQEIYDMLKAKILGMRDEINKQTILKIEALIKVQELERFLLSENYTDGQIDNIYSNE